MNIEHVSGVKYRIPREGKMRVDVTFYASEGILEDLKSEDYASLQQICNVATLPGVVEPALTMPDIHWGYGFPIGGVAAFDPEEGGRGQPRRRRLRHQLRGASPGLRVGQGGGRPARG